MAKKKQAKRPQLNLCAAAWTLTNYPSEAKQWSIDRKVRAAKDAGFVGFSAGADPEIAEACAKHGLQLVGGVDVATVEEAGPKLTAFKEAGAEHINIQLCDHDTEIRKAVTVARAVMKAGKELKLKPAIEWHRDTCTETPEKGLALAAQYEKRYKEKLRTNFDHSHPAIIKQLRPTNFWERIAEYRPDLLKMSEVDSLPHLYRQPLSDAGHQWPRGAGRGFYHMARQFPQALALPLGQRTARCHRAMGCRSSWGRGVRAMRSTVFPTCGRTRSSRAARSRRRSKRR